MDFQPMGNEDALILNTPEGRSIEAQCMERPSYEIPPEMSTDTYGGMGQDFFDRENYDLL